MKVKVQSLIMMEDNVAKVNVVVTDGLVEEVATKDKTNPDSVTSPVTLLRYMLNHPDEYQALLNRIKGGK